MIESYPITSTADWHARRRRDVTASVAGSLLGVHEYMTGFGLWAEKTGRIDVGQEETKPMRRGRLLEPVAAQLLAEEQPGWAITEPRLYLRDPDARLGATPDRYVLAPGRGQGIIQIKTVGEEAFRKKWRNAETREVELPLWIAIQAMIEQELSGREWAVVAAMVCGMGLDLHLIDVPYHAGVMARVRQEVGAFWALIEAGGHPDPDYGRDGSVIERIYAGDNGLTLDLSGDNDLPTILDERTILQETKTGAEARLKEIRAELIDRLGNHAIATVADGRVITAKTVRRSAYTVQASQYRDLRVRQPRANEGRAA